MTGNELKLSGIEKNTAKHIVSSSDDISATEDVVNLQLSSYFEKTEANRRRRSTTSSQYIDCKFIPANSVSAEHLSSSAHWIMTNLQKRITPILFEALHFFENEQILMGYQTCFGGHETESG